MSLHHQFQVIGFHSCDKEVGIQILNGFDQLIPSNNSWDWLGNGIYFWEQDPSRAIQYGIENANGAQFNKRRIKIPFVLGAIIELGNCLSLVHSDSLNILKVAYSKLASFCIENGNSIPVNKGNNRALDCAVIKYIHQINQECGLPSYTTIRSAFNEGEEVYPGYFLPQPVDQFNPYFRKDHLPTGISPRPG